MNKDFKKKHEIFMFKKVVKKNQNNIKKIIKTGCKKKHKIDIESYVMKKRIEKEYGKNWYRNMSEYRKNILKKKLKSYLLCFISSTSSYMNTPMPP